MCAALRDLRPLTVTVVAPRSEDLRLLNGLLAGYHDLGHRNTVGETLRYLLRDRAGRPVACVLFGSAAWTCAARDAWIGWDRDARAPPARADQQHALPRVALGDRAALGQSRAGRHRPPDLRRLAAKYGHPVQALIDHLLDITTAVDTARAAGLAALRRVFAGDPFVPAVHTS